MTEKSTHVAKRVNRKRNKSEPPAEFMNADNDAAFLHPINYIAVRNAPDFRRVSKGLTLVKQAGNIECDGMDSLFFAQFLISLR